MLTSYPEHAAVVQLQDAARSGRRVMIPGALEPLRQRPDAGVAPAEPNMAPVFAGSQSRPEAREAGGTPARAVTLLDGLQRIGLRLTEAVIRLLATPARFTTV